MVEEKTIEQQIFEEKAKCWDLLFAHAELWKNHTPHITWNAVELYDRLIDFMAQVESERVDKFYAQRKEEEKKRFRVLYRFQIDVDALNNPDAMLEVDKLMPKGIIRIDTEAFELKEEKNDR
jgi:hypothetical protein